MRKPIELFSKKGVTGLPDNFPIQQKDRLFLQGNIYNFIFKNNPAYCWMGEAIWQASDSSLTEELHGKTIN